MVVVIMTALLFIASAAASTQNYPGGYQFSYHFKYPGIVQNLLCIHHYEGAWNDPGSPYWGGLQMDLSFQDAYGHHDLVHHGTADHWTVVHQLRAGVRAVLVRGYSPWPNTARYCGLR
jgi:hypothetical protein